MRPIAVFYHSLYSPNSLRIVREAMEALDQTGLADAANHLQLCFNGQPYGEIPFHKNAIVIVHPEGSCNENLTLVAVHEFAKVNRDWNLLYFHSKGATHGPEHWSAPLMNRWRACMMEHCVHKWRECIEVLQCYEAVGAHWMEKKAHNIPFSMFGGNFWWARTEFLADVVPSLYERHKERTGKLQDWDNRYEAEVWIGTGSRDPIVFSYHPGHPGCHGGP